MKHKSYRRADCCYTCQYINGDGVALKFLFSCDKAAVNPEPDRRNYDDVDMYLDAIRQWERTNGVTAHFICDLYEANS